MEITGWETKVAPPHIAMAGQFDVLERVPNHWGPQVKRMTFELIDVAR